VGSRIGFLRVSVRASSVSVIRRDQTLIAMSKDNQVPAGLFRQGSSSFPPFLSTAVYRPNLACLVPLRRLGVFSVISGTDFKMRLETI